MTELFAIPVLPLLMTLGTYQIGLLCQKKLKLPIFNPILIAMVLVLVLLKITRMEMASYQSGMKFMSWLLTPATVCLAVPMYQHIQTLRKNLPAILAGVLAGTVVSLLSVLGLCLLFRLNWTVSATVIPKSVTSAISVVLAEMSGGIGSITTAVVIITGILGSMLGPAFCKIFRLTEPVAQGVAFGTAAHVVGTTKANEFGGLCGAVSSLSLVAAGIMTAVLMPILNIFAPNLFQ